MNRVIIASGCAFALGLTAVAFVGCEDTGLISSNFDTSAYTPEGCGFEVSPATETTSGLDDGLGTGTPDHVHVGWSSDPSSTVAVNWRTDTETTGTQVIYGTEQAAVEAADGPGDGVNVQSGHWMSYEASIFDTEPTQIHEVHICGLSPDTTYYYKAGSPGAWSEVYDISTGPPPGSTGPVRFAVSGDSRNEPSIWAEVQEAIDAEGVDFELFSGDAVIAGANQGQWNAFFQAESGNGFKAIDLLARMPLMVVNGNHDNLQVNYDAQFSLPQDKVDGELLNGEEWWSFDYGNVHIVGLNDSPEINAISQPQRQWLEADLAAVDRETTPWVFVVHHKPTYSCGGSHGSNLDIRSAWQPIFDRFQVDIVFAGHDHLYERSKPIRGLQGVEGQLAEAGVNGTPVDQSGTLYVVAAGAGAPLYGADDQCFHTEVAESTRNYVIVDIQDRTLEYTAYRLNGTVLDSFSYSK